ncbi:hypothetical protein H312_02606 [Anncaliia algerae PRA339]|uniref:Uncharacterized protein n=1 Tax=Anncaliia algerae PRA339 TaxID=1288291 RepID=A0A059EYJ4_9MICR|nr:hypothetical protein H312_02606 [Anncaliia algerae PRA339]
MHKLRILLLFIASRSNSITLQNDATKLEIDYITCLINQKKMFKQILNNNILRLCSKMTFMNNLCEKIFNKENINVKKNHICIMRELRKIDNKLLTCLDRIVEKIYKIMYYDLKNEKRIEFNHSKILKFVSKFYFRTKMQINKIKNQITYLLEGQNYKVLKNSEDFNDNFVVFVQNIDYFLKNLIKIDIFVSYLQNRESKNINSYKSNIILEVKDCHNNIKRQEENILEKYMEGKYDHINFKNVFDTYNCLDTIKKVEFKYFAFNLYFAKFIQQKLLQNEEIEQILRLTEDYSVNILEYSSLLNDEDFDFFKNNPQQFLYFVEYLIEEKNIYDEFYFPKYINEKEKIKNYFSTKFIENLGLVLKHYLFHYSEKERIFIEVEYFNLQIFNLLARIKFKFFHLISNDFIIEEIIDKYLNVSRSVISGKQEEKLKAYKTKCKERNYFGKDREFYVEALSFTINLENNLLGMLINNLDIL